MTSAIAQEYTIESALLDAERDIGGTREIANMIDELSFFESLDKMYITGQITLLDDLGLFDEIRFQGTETITFKIRGLERKTSRDRLEYKVRLVSIVHQVKLSDRQEVFTFNFISPHAYNDSTIKVSKSYTGNLEDIAENVLRNELGVEVNRDNYLDDATSSQGPIKVVIPYLSPLETTSWLISRATGVNGAPFFSWASLWDQEDGVDRIRFGQFARMSKYGYDEIQKGKRDQQTSRRFVYSMQSTMAAQSPNLTNSVTQAHLIKGLEKTKIEDTLKMIDDGSVGSMISNLDTFTSQRYDRHFSIRDFIETLTPAEAIMSSVFDPYDKIDTGKKESRFTDEHDARYKNVITSYGTYGAFNSYHDVFDQVEALNKVRPEALRTMLYRNLIQVALSGTRFLSEQLSVGDIIEIQFPTAFTENDGAGMSSGERSGYYLLYDLRHVFRDSKHFVTASVCKIRDLPDVTDTSTLTNGNGLGFFN